MNFTGVIIAALCFAAIGAFHPIVIKVEYHFGAGIWPLFLVLGLGLLGGALFCQGPIASSFLGILGASCLWSILELRHQERRVEKGWFPKNPRRKKAERE